jgi:ankyrin repeat protein
MVAAKQGDVELVRAFLAKSATPEAPDVTGHSAAHHAIAARQPGALELLLPTMRDVHLPDSDGRDLLTLACDTGDMQLIAAVLARANSGLPWNPSTRSALRSTMTGNQPELTRALLSKHAGPPTLDGSDVPLIVHAVVSEDIDTLKALLAAGADPNVPLPPAAGKDYAKAVTSSYLRSYVVSDQGVTPLMLAAGQERTDILGTLLQAGADKNRHTAKHKMMALYFAARTRNARAVQMLLGKGPSRDELRVEISLATQKATLYKNGTAVLNTAVSTGRKGFDTPAGEYVVTDKKRSHRSSIYHVEMPFFMRLNCLDFGLHAGAVPNYPASHGCVRVPASMAEKLFSEVPVGTVVTIN